MIIDCGRCAMAGTDACEDCVVTALVGEGGLFALVEEEQRAIEAMSKVGLVPPIRLVENAEHAVNASP